MPSHAGREVMVGSLTAVIIIGILTATVFGPRLDNRGQAAGLRLISEFGRIDGLAVGSPVRLAGVDVGVIERVVLTDERRVEVTLIIGDASLPIPSDTAAVIETDGIFGDKYLELHPGGEIDTLTSGQRISYSQDSVVLESLLNKIVSRAKAGRRAEGTHSNEGSDP